MHAIKNSVNNHRKVCEEVTGGTDEDSKQPRASLAEVSKQLRASLAGTLSSIACAKSRDSDCTYKENRNQLGRCLSDFTKETFAQRFARGDHRQQLEQSIANLRDIAGPGCNLYIPGKRLQSQDMVDSVINDASSLARSGDYASQTGTRISGESAYLNLATNLATALDGIENEKCQLSTWDGGQEALSLLGCQCSELEKTVQSAVHIDRERSFDAAVATF